MPDYGEQNQMIHAWEHFEGKIDCEYTGKLWDAEELIGLTHRLSDELREAGFGKGDIIVLMLTNTVAFPVILMSLLYLECNPLLLNAAIPRPEFDRLTMKFPVKYFIHDFIEGVSRFSMEKEEAAGNLEIGSMSVRIGKTGKSSYDGSCGKCDDYGNPHQTSKKGEKAAVEFCGAILHPTSGTFGDPGICIRNQKVAIAEGVNYISSIDLYYRIRIMATTPLSHAFGYGFGFVSAVLTHSELVLSPSFNPKKVLRSLTEKPCDILTIVPPMARVLMMLKESYPYFRMAKNVFSAGAHCSENLAEKFEEVFKARIYSIYGSTETGAICSNYTAAGKLPGVGKVLKNVSVCIRNTDQYGELSCDVGEVYVKSTSMMQGYFRKDFDVLPEIDYFFTGDLGCKSGDTVVLKGRVKDIINVNGMKVDAKEVENILLLYSGIMDAAAYPGSDANNNEIVLCTVCVKSDSFSLDSLRTHCLKHLAGYKVPRAFYILDELPRTASGKCIKVKLPGYK